MDITHIIEFLIGVAVLAITCFAIPAIKMNIGSARMATIIQVADTVVRAARELDITKELVKMGTNKVDYAFSQAKTALAAKNIKIDDDELKSYIKSAVTNLRISIDKTTETLSSEDSAADTTESSSDTTNDAIASENNEDDSVKQSSDGVVTNG